MQYDSIEELMLELSLYPDRKRDILKDCAGYSQQAGQVGWFAVAKDGNCALFDDNGDLDDISKVKILSYHMVVDGIEKINIPDGVETICDYTFDEQSKLREVHIPDSVKLIDRGAFNLCEALEKVNLPKDLKCIYATTFFDCESLSSIKLPSNIKEICDSAFYSCIGMTEITVPSSIQRIGFRSFGNMTSLNSLTIEVKDDSQIMKLKSYAYPWGIKDTSIIAFKRQTT